MSPSLARSPQAGRRCSQHDAALRLELTPLARFAQSARSSALLLLLLLLLRRLSRLSPFVAHSHRHRCIEDLIHALHFFTAALHVVRAHLIGDCATLLRCHGRQTLRLE